MNTQLIEKEIDNNFDYFTRNVGNFISEHRNEYALLRKSKIIDFFPSVEEAEKKAHHLFSDGIFSIQQVCEGPVDLGFFTYAVDNRQVG